MAPLINPDFDSYRLSDEHVMLRHAVRELADDKIAPRAAEIDETAEFPFDVLDAWCVPDSTRCTSPRSTAGPAPTPSRPPS